MSQKDKLVARLTSRPKDFAWDELKRLLANLGFDEISTGKTGGSRRKFYHKPSGLMINLHKPHPGSIVKSYAIEQVLEKLKEEKLI